MVSVQSLVAKIYEKHSQMGPDVSLDTWTLTPYEALELCESLRRVGLSDTNSTMRARFALIEQGTVYIMGVRLLVE